MEHYFTKNPNVKSKERNIEYTLDGRKYSFITDNGVFSKAHVDEGTKILVKAYIKEGNPSNLKVLDLGCGYGVVGIIVKSVFKDVFCYFVDINDRAIELTKRNIELNGIKDNYEAIQSDMFENVDESFDAILLNPPIRTGKKAIFEMYEKSYEKLNSNGELYVVIMTKHGAKSTEKKLNEMFKEVKCVTKDSGYRVYKAIKE